MNRKLQWTSAFGLILLLALSGAACLDNDDDDDDNKDALKITINGQEFVLSGLFSDHPQVIITGSDGKAYEGIPLSELVLGSDLSDPETFQYNITASDGYNRNVTWRDMQFGVLSEHAEDNTTTAFPHLPGKYLVRDVVSIEPVTTPTLLVNDWLYTWDQPFHKLEEVTVMDDENNNHTGVSLSDLVNDTGLPDPGSHNYTITGADDNSTNVAWEDMQNGILVKDEHRSVFPEKEKKFWIKDIVKIEVV